MFPEKNIQRSCVSEIVLASTLIFGPLAFGCIEPWSIAILEGMLFFLVLVSFRLRPAPGEGLINRTLLPVVLTFIVIGLFQIKGPQVLDAPRYLRPFVADPYETKRALLLWSAYASLLWSAPRILSSPRAQSRLAWTIFLIGFAISVIGIIQSAQGNRFIYGLRWVSGYRSPFGPYYNRNHASCLLVMSVQVGIGLFLSRFWSFKGKAESAAYYDLAATQAVIAFMLAVVLYAIRETRSFGGALSFVVSNVIVVIAAGSFLKRGGARLILRGACATVLLLAILVAYFKPNYMDAGKHLLHLDRDSSTLYRLSMYRGGIFLIRDFPITGIGLGAFASAFPPYQERIIEGAVQHVHSDWLELVLQVGLIGAALAAVGGTSFGWRVWRYWRNARGWEARCLLGGGIAAAIGFLIHGLVEFGFQTPANAVVFFWVLSWLGASSSDRSPALEMGVRGLSRSAHLSILGAGCALLLIGFCPRPLMGSYYLYRSERVSESEQPCHIARALRWDADPRSHYAMATTYITLADSSPAAETVLLRAALRHSTEALRGKPFDARFRYIQGAILWRLGRIADAREYI